MSTASSAWAIRYPCHMKRLLFWGIVAAAVYFGYNEVWLPKQQQKEQQAVAAAENAEARACVTAAVHANDTFLSEVRQLARPPVDSGVWSLVMVRISSQLSEGDGACGCAGEACRSAAAALYEIRQLVNQFDRYARARSQTMFNPASSQERIENLLEDARSKL